MFKTFIFGLILGIAGVAGVIYALPVVDQHRETSIISVKPNGGNVERFHISVPMDRIVAGVADSAAPVPPGLEWPTAEMFDGMNAEIFKIRNERDAVIGVASRLAATGQRGALIEWVLHLPARGSAYVTMNSEPSPEGYRAGSLRYGSREFTTLTGTMTERWVAAADDDLDTQQGRIELEVAFVSVEEPVEEAVE